MKGKNKMNEIRIYFFTFSVVSSIWMPNLRPFPLTFKRDKMNIVANICIWKFLTKYLGIAKKKCFSKKKKFNQEQIEVW